MTATICICKTLMSCGLINAEEICNRLGLCRQRSHENGIIRGILSSLLWTFLFFAVAVPLFLNGCSKRAETKPQTVGVLDLTDRFLPVNPAAQDLHLNRGFSVTRKGVRKDALVLTAPVSVCASLKGVSGRFTLEGLATPVFNIGDGIQLELYLSRAGKRQFIGKRYFDAGRKAEDRDWISIAFPLDLGEDDLLEIEISAGPQGDLVADWLALSSLSLKQREIEP